ncbi:hypothetical protein BDR07DRAFT_1487440 [Suillus spraguei]|nr:hypothetical protein BDR07DRAFT_1487440 [Suillus spraguei]
MTLERIKTAQYKTPEADEEAEPPFTHATDVELDPSNVSVDTVLQHIALGESSVPHGYSTDESGNLLVDNKSESYKRGVLDDMTGLQSMADGSTEVEGEGHGKRRRVANTQSSTMEEIQDELKPNDVNEECGGLAKNIEQVLDDGINLNNANKIPAVSIEGSLARNMSNTMERILYVLKGSAIADSEECVIDANSKFWQIYQKSSIGFHNSLVKQVNSDISIILTFAGLLSVIIAMFIDGMQPNPGDTDALLIQLIQIAANSSNSVPDISNISSSTHYSSTTVLAQAFAYASLLFSLLAAFRAVFAKQWLNSYKTAG